MTDSKTFISECKTFVGKKEEGILMIPRQSEFAKLPIGRLKFQYK